MLAGLVLLQGLQYPLAQELEELVVVGQFLLR